LRKKWLTTSRYLDVVNQLQNTSAGEGSLSSKSDVESDDWLGKRQHLGVSVGSPTLKITVSFKVRNFIRRTFGG
jgi:hypothetical protein